MALLKKVQVCFKSKKDRTTSTLRFASNGHTFKTMYISTHLAHDALILKKTVKKGDIVRTGRGGGQPQFLF